MITVIVPTRNRPDDLANAISSIITQLRQPDELLIIDQSPGNESRNLVERLLTNETKINLNYIHESSISGLVEAKQVGVSKARGNIICFLEDDIVLEHDYLYQIEKGFNENAEMLGCCGVVTNPPIRPWGYNIVFQIFHRGIFRDPRVGLYGNFSGDNHKFILSDVLSGGLSAWRSNVFSTVSFDVANSFFMLEDMEFSTRVAKHFGHFLYINPNAKLAHYSSSVNRELLGPRQRRKLIEYITYYKKRREWPGAHFDIAWLLFGLMGEALFQSMGAKSINPLVGYLKGIREGIFKDLTSQAGNE